MTWISKIIKEKKNPVFCGHVITVLHDSLTHILKRPLDISPMISEK